MAIMKHRNTKVMKARNDHVDLFLLLLRPRAVAATGAVGLDDDDVDEPAVLLLDDVADVAVVTQSSSSVVVSVLMSESVVVVF
jgi:hypothetical protein